MHRRYSAVLLTPLVCSVLTVAVETLPAQGQTPTPPSPAIPSEPEPEVLVAEVSSKMTATFPSL
jgi:hypothetical protein